MQTQKYDTLGAVHNFVQGGLGMGVVARRHDSRDG